MAFVYRVPNNLAPAVLVALANEGVYPGDRVVIRHNRPPAVVREVGHGVAPLLWHLDLLSADLEAHPLPSQPPPGQNGHPLRVVQGGA